MRKLTQAPHIFVLDMAPILAQMHRDAIGASEVRLDRRPHWIRLVGAAGLPHGCDMVDIDAEFDHSS